MDQKELEKVAILTISNRDIVEPYKAKKGVFI